MVIRGICNFGMKFTEAEPTNLINQLVPVTLKNYSSILSQPFGYGFKGFLYKLLKTPSFGLVLPFEYNPVPKNLLEFLEELNFNDAQFEAFKKFQHQLWSDLYLSKGSSGTLALSNYLVLPLKNNLIDWDKFLVAIKEFPCLTLKEVTSDNLESLVLYSGNSKTSAFFYDKHEGNKVVGTRVKSCRSKDLSANSVVESLDKELKVHYLTKENFMESHQLLESLCEVEAGTWLVEFSQIFGYTGRFSFLREATQTPGFSKDSNFNTLETLGDTVLKMVASMYYFFYSNKANEHYLSKSRAQRVNNAFLAEVAEQNLIHKYLRTAVTKPTKFKPPYYKALQLTEAELTHLLSKKMLADCLEALIGAFALECGLPKTAEFIKQLGILEEGPSWEFVFSLLNGYSYEPGPEKVFEADTEFSELVPLPAGLSELETTLGYSFSNKDILARALTHPSFGKSNYEILEFLGDSLIDYVVLMRIFSKGRFSPDQISLMKHILVNGTLLSRYSVSLNLDKFIQSNLQVQESVKHYIDNLNWNLDLKLLGFSEDLPPKCLNDLFEALCGAILVDSGNLDIACKFADKVMSNCIDYVVCNVELCQKSIFHTLSAVAQQEKINIKISCKAEKGVFYATAKKNGTEIAKASGSTKNYAKQKAAFKALSYIKNNNGVNFC